MTVNHPDAGSIPAAAALNFRYEISDLFGHWCLVIGHLKLGDRLTAGCRALNPVMQVQILLPDLTANRDESRVSLMQKYSGAVAAGSDAWL